ncbi:MAG: HAD family hydrolase [Desulfuromonadales bacterium]|nr:HAD family hydrolase [Desulfuromonadales bacterium]
MKRMLTSTTDNSSHWIFDLDGTLTVAVHDFAAIRRELEIPIGSDILGHLDSLPPHHAQPLLDRLQEIELELAGLTRAATGALALLQHLLDSGAQMGVLTRNTRENALRTLKLVGLGRFFDPVHVLGRDEALPKPDPDGIHRLAHIWGIAPGTIVMVGDYQYDLQAGRSAGALTIHVDATRSFRWPELADVSVGTLEELFQRISSDAAFPIRSEVP